jgi:hypothetical protein
LCLVISDFNPEFASLFGALVSIYPCNMEVWVPFCMDKPLPRCQILYSGTFCCRYGFVTWLAHHPEPLLLAEHTLNESRQVGKAT